MKRTDKYPETRSFHFHNENPKNRITGDCTFRAIARATGKDWRNVVMEMAQLSCETGYAINDDKGIERYLEKIGWVKHKQPRKVDNTKFTGKEFCKALKDPEYREFFTGTDKLTNIICHIGGHHVTCIVAGKINDIWDCSNKCIGNYWTKEV